MEQPLIYSSFDLITVPTLWDTYSVTHLLRSLSALYHGNIIFSSSCVSNRDLSTWPCLLILFWLDSFLAFMSTDHYSSNDVHRNLSRSQELSVVLSPLLYCACQILDFSVSLTLNTFLTSEKNRRLCLDFCSRHYGLEALSSGQLG